MSKNTSVNSKNELGKDKQQKPLINWFKGFHFLATIGQALIFFVVLSVVFSSGSPNLAWEDFGQPSQGEEQDPEQLFQRELEGGYVWQPSQKEGKQESTIPLPNDWFTFSFAAIISVSAAILSSQILPVGAVKVSKDFFAFLESEDDSKRKEKLKKMREKIKQMNKDFQQRQKELRQDIENNMRRDFEQQKETLQQKFEIEKEKVGENMKIILEESFDKQISALEQAMKAQTEKEILAQGTKLTENFEKEKEILRTEVTRDVKQEKDDEFKSRQELNRLLAVPTLQERQIKNARARQKEVEQLLAQMSKDVEEDATTIFSDKDLK